MKIDVRDNNLIVFLNNKNILGIDFYNTRELEKYFRELFFKLSDDYSFDLSGSYNIDVFIDRFGVVLEIEPIDSYYDCCDIVDMNITISKYKGFLYKSDCFIDVDCDVYLYDSSFYYEPLNVSFLDIGKLFENCDIVYGFDVYDIKRNGKLLSRFVIDKLV